MYGCVIEQIGLDMGEMQNMNILQIVEVTLPIEFPP